MTAVLQVYRSRSRWRGERWRWRLVAANGRTVAESDEGYRVRATAEAMGLAVCRGSYRVSVRRQ